jgi:AcrR family transcriptional regulator
MTISEDVASRRPMRADARRNYDSLLEAARSAFAEKGAEASLEDIARRAEVGVGTLYRHFPTRQALLESVYLEEVEALCSSVADLTGEPPWDALTSWLDRFVDYISTKRALGEQLLATMSPDSTVFRNCHDAIYAAGEPLLQRAKVAGVVRPDVEFTDVIRLVSGVTMVKAATPEEIRRVLAIALDGLRFRLADA